MKYRFTLSRQSGTLALSVAEWVREAPLSFAGELITAQIIEDFMPREYFLKMLEKYFGEAGSGAQFAWPYSEESAGEVIAQINRLASPERFGRTADNYTGLIGKTPLLRLRSLAAGCGATVLVKLECLEPNSVKDRPVLSIVRGACERGEISDKTEIVEASSGNVAFALSAILKVLLNKKPLIFISKMHGPAKARAVRVSGAPVMLTPAASGTASAKKASVEYARDNPGVFQVNQHGNPDNPQAHRLTTGPELYHQCHVLTGQPPAEFVTGLGSCGTAVGVAMFRDDIGADFKVIGVEPEEASLLTGGEFHAHRFSGLAPGFVTGIFKKEGHRIDQVVRFNWQEGFEVCRRLLVEEGILAGASTGASIGAALQRARMPENEGKVIVTIAHDRGDRYLGIDDLFTPPAEAVEKDLAP